MSLNVIRLNRAIVLSFAAAVLIATTSAPTSAQEQSQCETSAAMKRIRKETSSPEFERMPYTARSEKELALIKQGLAENPRDIFLLNAYQDTVIYGSDGKDAAIKKSHEEMEKHPGDAIYIYLYARAMVRRDTKASIEYFQRASGADPAFAMPHLSLASIYQSNGFEDKQKATEQVKAFLALCPNELSIYPSIQKTGDADLIKQSAAKLRARLAAETDPEALAYYPTLWSLEQSSQSDDLRLKTINDDLARLKSLAATEPRLLQTIAQGYEKIGNKDEADKARAQTLKDDPYSDEATFYAYEKWFKAHPNPSANASEADRTAYYRELYDATSQWLGVWPENAIAWQERVQALGHLKGLSNAQVESEADAIMAAKARNGSAFPSVSDALARIYVDRNIRLDRVPALIDDALAENEKLRKQFSDDDMQRADIRKMVLSSVDSTMWNIRKIEIEADLLTGQTDKAASIIASMQDWQAKNKPDDKADGEQRLMYSSSQGIYWECKGRLAEAQQHKLDALVYYRNAIAAYPRRGQSADQYAKLTDKVTGLWKELGGTSDGLLAYNDAASDAATGEIASETAWTKTNEKMPDFDLTDMQGRKWTLAELKGKVAFVNVWATWCGPCQQELPHLQKLFDRVKDRKDVILLTLNVDEDRMPIAPFLKSNHYSFPVLPAYAFVRDTLKVVGIPRNWIIGPDGTKQMEELGFDGDGDEFIKGALAAISEAGGASSNK